MTRLYLITPSVFELEAFVPQLEAALSGGDVGCVQLRMKAEDNVIPAEAGIHAMKNLSQSGNMDASPKVYPREGGGWHDEVKKAALRLMPIVHAHNIPFIINDYPGIAAENGADGVRVGDEDMPADKVRKIVGEGKVIGVSCYGSRDRAFEAGEQGADYVAFGQFFETKTKPPKGRPTPEILEFWSQCTNLPCVAIGGIKPDNLAPLVRAGADFLAVVTGVWEHPQGPKAAVEAYNAAIKAAKA